MMEMQEDDIGIDQLKNKDYFKILSTLQQMIFKVPIISIKEDSSEIVPYKDVSEEMKIVQRDMDISLSNLRKQYEKIREEVDLLEKNFDYEYDDMNIEKGFHHFSENITGLKNEDNDLIPEEYPIEHNIRSEGKQKRVSKKSKEVIDLMISKK